MSNPANAAVYAQFMRNKFAEMSHKFCSAGLNLSAAKLSEIEQTRFDTCLSKYGQAFNIYKEEQSIFFRNIADIESQGGDKFAKFNEYDKFWNFKNDKPQGEVPANFSVSRRENRKPMLIS